MGEYISKDTLIAEIEKRIKEHHSGYLVCLKDILSFLNTLEVKDVEEKYECPNIKIKDTIEVSSRMKYVDEDLKSIADFIMNYASWNLHKDEWNHPVLEVPLFRVLDALVQRGKPYCEG